MKKLLFVIVLLSSFTAEAQNVTVGFVGRFGAFNTFASSDNTESDADYSVGLQAALGAWVKLPLAAKSSLQVSALQIAERQGAGETVMYDENRNPFTNATKTDRNLAVVLQTLYLYNLSDKLSAGIGVGAKYEYLSEYKLEALLTYDPVNPNYSEEWEYKDKNQYRRSLAVHVPVETQYKLSDKFTVLGQVQLPISNRSTEAAYKEYDLNLSVGVSYTL